MKKRFKRNICIVEKDAVFEKRLARGFEKYNTSIIVESDILKVMEISKQERLDALIIGEDIKDKLNAVQKIIDSDRTIPAVFICKDKEEKQNIEQFDSRFFAIVKPFTSTRLNEFINNVKSLKFLGVTFDIGKYSFDFNTRKLTFFTEDGRELQQVLTKKEAGILLMLVSNRNEVVLRKKILNNFWYDENYSNSRSMDVYMTRLRSYLSMDKSITIENIHSKGYKIVF